MIDDIRPQGIPLNQNGGVRGPRPTSGGEQAPEGKSAAGARRGDTVEISGEARARLADATAGGLDPERAAEIRQKMLDGSYNTTAVKRAVAERIIASGDLGL